MEKKKKITNKNCMKKKKFFVEIFLNKNVTLFPLLKKSEKKFYKDVLINEENIMMLITFIFVIR